MPQPMCLTPTESYLLEERLQRAHKSIFTFSRFFVLSVFFLPFLPSLPSLLFNFISTKEARLLTVP